MAGESVIHASLPAVHALLQKYAQVLALVKWMSQRQSY
jgi:hypothetical protein